MRVKKPKVFAYRVPIGDYNYLQRNINYMLCVVLHTRGWWNFSLADIKKTFWSSDLWSKISHVLVVQLETFSP